MSSKFRNMSILVILAAALIITGCSGNSPLAPATDQNDQITSEGMTFPNVKASASSVTIEVEGFITALSGGLIEVNSAAFTHSFAVEAEGVSEDVNITVKYTKEIINNTTMAVFQFGPSGLVFNDAANLEYDISELNVAAQKGSLYYFNPALNDWILQDSVDVASGKVDFAIYHFSKYAISD